MIAVANDHCRAIQPSFKGQRRRRRSSHPNKNDRFLPCSHPPEEARRRPRRRRPLVVVVIVEQFLCLWWITTLVCGTNSGTTGWRVSSFVLDHGCSISLRRTGIGGANNYRYCYQIQRQHRLDQQRLNLASDPRAANDVQRRQKEQQATTQQRRRIPFLSRIANTAAAAAAAAKSTRLYCQLLGMNCAVPTVTEFALSWSGFCERGGGTDVHADGWGLAYYDDCRGSSTCGGGLRTFHDVEAASTSPLARFVGQQPIRTSNLLAHIRYATAGAVDLANVHPFSREMWGINWCFCHNGQVPLMEDHPDYWLGGGGDPSDTSGQQQQQEEGGHHRFYVPIGQTDSEAFFCALLNALRAEFTDTMPSLPVLYDRIDKLCRETVDYNPTETILNFLLTCGPHVLWVYSWPGKRPGSTVWNGLHYTVRGKSTKLGDDDYEVKVSISSTPLPSPSPPGTVNGDHDNEKNTMENQGKDDGSVADHGDNDDDDDDESRRVCIVATKPLTAAGNEEWVELKKGELIVFDGGLPHVSPKELFRVELQGHGLNNDGKVLRPARLEEDMRRYQFRPEFYVGGGI